MPTINTQSLSSGFLYFVFLSFINIGFSMAQVIFFWHPDCSRYGEMAKKATQ
jgi:hypothetical protein